MPTLSDSTWRELLANEMQKSYFLSLMQFLNHEEKAGKLVYPPQNEIFNALNLCPFARVKIVLLGQDPYHGANQAMGLSFSVKAGVKRPPSLKNIFKLLNRDLGLRIDNAGDLSPWARQGVLLLNSCLTVVAGKASSHAKIGWQEFTDAIIESLNQHHKPVVFLLWGAFAQKKAALIDKQKHFILEAPHPSPLSAHRGFFDCEHFSKANRLLADAGRTPIDWQL